MRHARWVAAAIIALTTTGCGPGSSVTLGIKDVATDILLRQAHAAPPPPVVVPPGFPFTGPPLPPGGAAVDLPPPTGTLPAMPPPGSCPKASPLAAAVAPADADVTGPPVAKSYAVRVRGNYLVTGPHKNEGAYGPGDIRQIHNVVTDPAGRGWSFDITDGSSLTTSYFVQPQEVGQDVTTVRSEKQSIPAEAGIYVTQWSYKRTDGSTLALTPNPAVMVAKLPFGGGDKWISRGTDTATGITIIVNGQNGIGATHKPLHDRVDACGTVLDAFWSSYTVNTQPTADQTRGMEPTSELVGPSLSMAFAGSQIAFAPQYGGIPIEEVWLLKGDDGSDHANIDKHVIYSQAPALASRSGSS